MIYLNWVGQKWFYYNFDACLCATEIRAFINFQNVMIRLHQPGTACTGWYTYESHCCTVHLQKQVLCAVFFITCLCWGEINQFSILYELLLNTPFTVMHLQRWKREAECKQIASGLATHREQNQQQISIHEHISSGHYCAVMEPSVPASFQPPVTCWYVTLMKNAACFDHHNITILFFLYVDIRWLSNVDLVW